VSEDKLDDICGMSTRTVSREAIRAEIEKCEVVCANCHRTRTHLRRLGVAVQSSQLVKRFGTEYVSMLVYCG
jgi:hypothetical protein